MKPRISVVNHVNIIAVGLSSIFKVGDTFMMTPFSRAIALQREVPTFFGDEAKFSQYDIFYRLIPKPVIYEKIFMKTENRSPYIKVNNVRVMGISASGVMQIGSNVQYVGESRIKHIRNLIRNE